MSISRESVAQRVLQDQIICMSDLLIMFVTSIQRVETFPPPTPTAERQRKKRPPASDVCIFTDNAFHSLL